MSIRALLVDDSADFRRLLRQHIVTRWADAIIVDYDPLVEGVPSPDFATGFDVVLLDYRLGDYDGFDWLRRFVEVPDFPPVVMITGDGSETLAVKMIKAGASDYISKQEMTHKILVATIQEAVDRRGAVRRYEWFEAEKKSGDAEDIGVPGYRKLSIIARGGFGSVVLAERLADGRKVVLKFVGVGPAGAENDQDAVARFQRETKLLRRLDHPSVVRIFDEGQLNGYLYQVMEYFELGSLRELIYEKQLPTGQAINYTIEIARALKIVHGEGILHRDLKPANVMLRPGNAIALIDFGAAKRMRQASHVTMVGHVIGTPYYMSPEQANNEDMNERSDIYSLGVMFYEMLMRAVPYTARTPLAVLYKQVHAPLPQLPPPLAYCQPILERMMAKRPETRFVSAADCARALERIRGSAG